LNEALAQKYPNSFSQNAKERGKEARFRKNGGNVLLRPQFFCLQQVFNLLVHIHGSGAEQGFGCAPRNIPGRVLFASRDFDLRNDAAAFRNQFYMPDDRYLGFHCSNEITVTDLGSSVEDFLLAVVTLRASLTTFGPFGKQRRFTVSVPYAQITRKLRYR
jgi:hypothetical protein